MTTPAAKPPASLRPEYFGGPEQALFGCYHEPARANRRDCAVLICQPIGHEYVNCHRALRQLAARLAEAGFPVLRFDYYGCGDSSGSSEEGTIAQWLQDIATAASHLRKTAGATRMCLVGLRLGGTLSAIRRAQRDDIESMVLWDPVLNGKNYLEDLFSLQREMLRFRPRPRRRPELRDCRDILGFPLSRFLHSEIENLDLLQLATRPARNLLLIQTDPAEGDDKLRNHLKHLDVRLEYQRPNAPHLWMPAADGGLSVPALVLQSIVSWVSTMHS
jgi:alpha/beta superfamily hydrolase